jgi:hypothetical protein
VLFDEDDVEDGDDAAGAGEDVDDEDESLEEVDDAGVEEESFWAGATVLVLSARESVR